MKKINKKSDGVLLSFFSECVKKLENKNVSTLLLVLYAFFVIQIRIFLESFSTLPKYIFIQPFVRTFFHYTIWYFVVLLFFVVFLSLVTSESIDRVFRFVLLLSPLLWIAPILDLIISGGAMMGYIRINNIPDLFRNIFGWLWINRGPVNTPSLTLGMTIQSIIVIFSLSSYVFIKTRNAFKTLVSFFGLYFFALFIGSFPYLIPIFLKSIGLDGLNSSIAFFQNYSSGSSGLGVGPDRAVSYFLFLFLIILFLILFYRYNKEKFSYFFKYLSKSRALHYMVLLNLGIFSGIASNYLDMGWSYLVPIIILLANFVVVLSWCFAKMVNDYFDKKEDLFSNKDSPFLNNKLTKNEVLFIYSIIIILILSISYALSYEFFFLTFLTIGASILYSAPPLRFKKVFLMSHLLMGLASGLVFLQGVVLSGQNLVPYNYQLKMFVAIIIFFFFGSHIKDIKDYEGDRNAGVRTLTTIFGVRRAKIIISMIIPLMFFLSLFFFGSFSLIFVALFFSVIFIYLMNTKEYSDFFSYLTYSLFFLIIFSNYLFKFMTFGTV